MKSWCVALSGGIVVLVSCGTIVLLLLTEGTRPRAWEWLPALAWAGLPRSAITKSWLPEFVCPLLYITGLCDVAVVGACIFGVYQVRELPSVNVLVPALLLVALLVGARATTGLLVAIKETSREGSEEQPGSA
jgi:hypothetical protein